MWPEIRETFRRLRRTEDEFVYEPVVVGSFEDAALAVVFNPNLQAVVISVSQWELSDRATIHVDEPTRELTLPWQLGQSGRRISDDEEARMAVGTVWRLYNYRGQLRNSLEAWAGRQPPENPRRGYLEYRENTRLRERTSTVVRSSSSTTFQCAVAEPRSCGD